MKISKEVDYKEYLNQYDVIKINIQEFLSMSMSVEEMLNMLQTRLLRELKRKYPEYVDSEHLVFAMQDIYAETKYQFVILIDEWDCMFREYKEDIESQKKYLDFLRMWLKDKEYVALAYMTGILPIKKYGSHSALNMFTEYSMLNPRDMAEYFGFTGEEVKSLCSRYDRNFQEAQAWYDGYELVTLEGNNKKTYAMYSPKSVVDAMLSGIYDNYWNQTETYEALKIYISMNVDGLKDAVIRMLAGDRIEINTGTFSNDMTSFQGRDDILTLLVHLGYLSYHWPDRTVSDDKKHELSEKLSRLPEEKGFDRRFQSVPDAIKKKAKRTYKVTAGIELKISDLENENDIWAYEDNYGRKYLRIRLSNEQTFQTFAHSDEENREE